jgi:hypothetical protein
MERSNFAKTPHLEQGFARRRTRVEALLMQVQVNALAVDLVQQLD